MWLYTVSLTVALNAKGKLCSIPPYFPGQRLPVFLVMLCYICWITNEIDLRFCMWALSSSTVLCLKIFRLLVFFPQVVLLSYFWWGLIRASAVRWRECMWTMNMTLKYATGRFRLWWDIALHGSLHALHIFVMFLQFNWESMTLKAQTYWSNVYPKLLF